LIAEEVEKVNPDLVVRDEDGKVSTVRYEAVNAMLLNEFLKEHRRVAEQQTRIADQQASLTEQQSMIAKLNATVTKQLAMTADQQKEIEALKDGLQKVSAAVELNQRGPLQVNTHR
jgi:uncharacterized coiled-coil protein SlyX